MQALDVSGSGAISSEEQTKGRGYPTPGFRDQVQDVPCLSSLRIHTEKSDEKVVTSIRVADVTLGIGRIPAGFYTTVQHSGCEWRTANVPVSLSNDVAQWDELIPIPCDMYATISLCIYASFEFQPMLGDGEQLRELVVTVEQLIDHSAGDIPFTFFPKDGDDMSPCLSILVKVKQRQSNDLPGSRILDPYCSIAESQSELRDVTNEGHVALSRYRKHGERRDLEHSIGLFERVLDICPPHHHCRAVAEANVAMTKFIHCQMGDSDISLDIPLALYRNALAARPIGHPDRPSTLIQLAAVLYTQFEKRNDGVDATEAASLLGEAIDLSSADSHEKRAALLMLEQHAKRNVQVGTQSPVEQDSASESHDEDPLTLGMQLLARFQQLGDLDDLELAISHLDVSVRSASGRRHVLGLANLGMALLKRFDRLGEPGDIEEGISRLQAALDLIPDGSPGRLLCLGNLGQAFVNRFWHSGRGELRDIERALTRFREAVDLSPDSHPNKRSLLSNLANAFFTRFDHLAELSDLEQAITSYRDAVDLTPDSHPSKPIGLKNLGKALKARFGLTDDLRDLEQAILRLRHAVNLTPDDNPSKPRYLIDLGDNFRTRFQRSGDLGDISQAVSVQTEAVDLTPDAHPDRPIFLNDVGNSLFIRFEYCGELSDLVQAIRRQEDAVKSVPDGHPRKPSILSSHGNALLRSFGDTGKLSDIEQAISRFSSAIDLTADGHSDKPTYLHNLGVALQARFRAFGELDDLGQAISQYKYAIDLTPDGHANKSAQLHNLSEALKARFERLGEIDDLERAVWGYREAINLSPEDHPDKAIYLNDLANVLLSRFKHLWDIRDLEQATSMQMDAVNRTSDDHPRKYAFLNNVCNTLIARFDYLGDLGDLQQAISKNRKAIELIPTDHPDRAFLLDNLGTALHTRFERLGELSDIEEAIGKIRNAIDLLGDSHHSKPTFLKHLGSAFLSRFQSCGKPDDLECAISRYGDSLRLTTDDHPDKPNTLTWLGNAFMVRFEYSGRVDDLEQAISRSSEAANLISDGHPGKAGPLSNLGNAFRASFECSGVVDDLDQAISKQMDAVNLTPKGHPDKPFHINNLGNAFKARFECFGDVNDLKQAMSMYVNAAESTPDGHLHKPERLNNLGNTFLHRFRLLGESSDLEQAIWKYKDAVDTTSPRHIYKPLFLNNLGNAYLTRFKRFGDLRDLDQAISISTDALLLIPDDYSRKPTALNTLGNALSTRFQHLMEISDIEQAISRHGQAVELTQDGHPSKPLFLNNLSVCFLTRFEHLGDIGDIEQAVSRSRYAVSLIPDKEHYERKPVLLNNLGNAILTRFEQLRELADLEEAISEYKQAVDITPEGHPYKPSPLTNLGKALRARFEHHGGLQVGDLDEAISAHERVNALTPDDHPDKPDRLSGLGIALVHRFDHLKEQQCFERAISLFSQAACASAGPTTARFSASLRWISCARSLKHHSLLHAYSVAVSLLPQLAWIGYDLTNRYKALKKCTEMVREAAAAALDSGDPQTAIEWLEQGRSIVWTESLQLRSSYEELSDVYPDHARRLLQLSTELELASVKYEKSLSLLSEHWDARSSTKSHVTDLESTSTLEQEANRHRSLATERDRLLQEIRGFPGFQRFLLHKEFSQLRASAHSGPVVILNAAESRCDALIVRAELDHVIHVPLHGFTFKQLGGLQGMLKSLLCTRVQRYSKRDAQLAPLEGIDWESFLSPLWKCVVKPVLDALGFSTPGKLSRIFWCPTGPFVFLPIHAAGFYDAEYSEPGHKTFDFVISSYTPTLSILTPSPSPVVLQNGNLRILAVRQPRSDGLPELPGAETELDYIKEVIGNLPLAQTTLIEPSLGTVEETLTLMKEADWAHFACHGVQDSRRPADSGLCLADRRRLKLTDIIALSRPQGGLAFLSACQTATGDIGLLDEAIHIAAGMLFAGYRSVVGTMWSISDRLAPAVARDVYEQLFQNHSDARPDYREAALALQEAVGKLRDNGASFDEWLPFIHVGF